MNIDVTRTIKQFPFLRAFRPDESKVRLPELFLFVDGATKLAKNKYLRFCLLLCALIVVLQLFQGLSPAGSTTSKKNSQETLKERDVKQIMELFIFARFHARPGQETGVGAALRKLLAPTRQEPGCLSIQAFRSIRDEHLFYIHSRWVDEAAFDDDVSQPYTKQFVEEVQPLIDHEFDTTRANLVD